MPACPQVNKINPAVATLTAKVYAAKTNTNVAAMTSTTSAPVTTSAAPTGSNVAKDSVSDAERINNLLKQNQTNDSTKAAKYKLNTVINDQAEISAAAKKLADEAKIKALAEEVKTNQGKVVDKLKNANKGQTDVSGQITNDKYIDMDDLATKNGECITTLTGNYKSITDLGGCIMPPKPGVDLPNEKQINSNNLGKLEKEFDKPKKPDTDEKPIDNSNFGKINTALSKFAMKKAYC